MPTCENFAPEVPLCLRCVVRCFPATVLIVSAATLARRTPTLAAGTMIGRKVAKGAGLAWNGRAQGRNCGGIGCQHLRRWR